MISEDWENPLESDLWVFATLSLEADPLVSTRHGHVAAKIMTIPGGIVRNNEKLRLHLRKTRNPLAPVDFVNYF